MQKYEQIRVLGQGGFGKAILARRKSDRTQVVIKEVRLTALGPKDREEALKESKVLASLKHPYIVEYSESFQERGCLYIVMGFADGGDLAGKIERAGRRPFSEDEILHDFIEIALAIKYIHDRKILHRDLKGQNVFLMKDGTVKLGDFGIAKVLAHTFQVCRTQIGTPYYLSPEICQGRNYNAKTDIWSLGCILYELCTLKHAFEAGNMNQLLMAIVRGRYAPI
jgi:NIMA (never in mitosis gene a)-related kinase